jgi:arginine decarboxylase
MERNLLESELLVEEKKIILGNRIPKDFFVTSGIGESDITIHAGSFHLALKDAGIEKYNIINYSSILPAIANQIERPQNLVHGSVMETIMACAHAEKGEVATAGLVWGWLFNRLTGEKYGGLVCEYNGHDNEKEAREILEKSLLELYDGFCDDFELRSVEIMIRSFVPKKKYGTALTSICFVNHEFPVLDNRE